MIITDKIIQDYRENLINEEKAAATVERYLRDVKAFAAWLGDCPLQKETALAYKAHLCETYAPSCVNTVLSSLNSFFSFLGHPELRVRFLRVL